MSRKRRTRKDPMDDLMKTITGSTEALVGIAAMTAITSEALRLVKKT